MLHHQLPRLDNTFVAWSSGCQLLCPSHSPCTAPARIRNENSHSPFDHHYPAPITPVAPTRHQCSLSSGTSLFLTVLHLCYHSDSIVWLLWYTSVTPALCFTTKICLAHHRKCMHQRYVDACSSCGELSYAFLFHSDSLAGASAFLCKGWLVSINCNWISLEFISALCVAYIRHGAYCLWLSESELVAVISTEAFNVLHLLCLWPLYCHNCIMYGNFRLSRPFRYCNAPRPFTPCFFLFCPIFLCRLQISKIALIGGY